VENLRGRGSAEAHHEEEADREPDAAAGGSVRHVIVGLWLILVRMSASGPRLGIETDVRNDIWQPRSRGVIRDWDSSSAAPTGSVRCLCSSSARNSELLHILVFLCLRAPARSHSATPASRQFAPPPRSGRRRSARASLSADDDWRAGFGKEQTRRPAAVGRRDPDVGCRR